MFNISALTWLNKPEKSDIQASKITITTEPSTDLWQRTYTGNQNDNTHALLMEIDSDFTFSVKASFKYNKPYDQCGVLIYQDSDNWFKGSIEHENFEFSHLGSVLTNNGYSDWSTSQISSGVSSMFYRISRQADDFLLENSLNGVNFRQMRMFHLFNGKGALNFGVYACSPLQSSFDAIFTDMKLTSCIWPKIM